MRFDIQREMTCLETRYFGVVRFLLLTAGLWPYEQSTFVRLQLILLYSILLSFIIFQFTAFVTLKCTLQIVIEVCSNTLFFIFCIIKYSAYSFNVDVKHLLELLQHIHNELRDECEVAIIENYWIIARRYNGILALLGLLTCSLPLCLPYILDTLYFTNESQSSPSLHIITEYFISKERYSFLMILHSNVAFFVAVIALIAPGSMNIMYITYVCGMFKIASYRIEQAMTKINLQTKETKGRNIIYIGIINAVDMHRKAMQMSNLFQSMVNVCMIFMAVTAVLSASLNLFRIFHELTSGCDIKKLVWPFLFLSIIYMTIFAGNILAQEIMDHNNDIFVTAYNVQWYIAPLHIQKLILFLLQRGTKNFNLIIAGIFVGCLEGFATMCTASVSYFTFIYSASHQ